ncbi:DUF4198 domain-containing protein [Desulfogranum japonicum]|uniref:DUF4198 domain-containing protein n=1 Tax=Desulfogranum japonicum TaxID=231447 RepID=UPI000408767C|nr:DUF4198 domain-containing protein [Desulfogranum japonicum]
MILTRTLTVSACLLTLLTATTSSAHDMWLEKTNNMVKLKYGHPGHSDPYPIQRITAINGYTDIKWKVILTPLPEDGEAFCYVTDHYPLITVAFDNWYWYHSEEEGWQQFQTPQKDFKGTILEEGASYKLSKEIVYWKPFLAQPIGQRAEIVPLKDPTTLKEGDMLPVQLYFEGELMPVEDSRTSLTSNPSVEHPELVFRSNQEPVMVKVGPPGRQIVIGKYAKPLEGVKKVWFAFSLTFTTTE